MKAETIEALERVYDEILHLSRLGATPALRRAAAVVSRELEEQGGARILDRCHPDWPHDHPRGGRGEPHTSFGFDRAYFEQQQEDRRASILLDPEEALASKLADFYLGRLDVLEVRTPRGFLGEIEQRSHSKAVQYIRDNHGIVSVLSVATKDREEAISMLRCLAYSLEQGTVAREKLEKLPKLSVLLTEKCDLVRVEAGATRWLNNGRRLEQQHREVYSCLADDACCTNQAYTKYGPWTWRLVWEDGNTNQPPPSNPPPFTPSPWQNRCPVLAAGMNATQTSDWGWRTINGQPDFHGGIDIAVPVGTPVFNTVAGTVVLANGHSPGGETGVVVRTGNQTRTYWHVVPGAGMVVGAAVTAGQQLGVTAAYPQPHLHFALHNPPNGDPGQRSDANSADPCP
ncbi:M23 family metallopeptidase [Bradyrhizobium sp. CCBAU 65884]|uniref:M23 family metallopeptidase n=1 Tax=Bradyrhizobium sp. CCBAU 65884 TaxID=722477 RepID=UPI0023053CA3|nr:M23 family metallopeptidase [Bradyrhizobium sp. CCBAU 65884]